MKKQYYTRKEAVRYIQPPVSLRRLYKMLADGKFPHSRPCECGNGTMFLVNDLDNENERRKSNAWIKK